MEQNEPVSTPTAFSQRLRRALRTATHRRTATSIALAIGGLLVAGGIALAGQDLPPLAAPIAPDATLEETDTRPSPQGKRSLPNRPNNAGGETPPGSTEDAPSGLGEQSTTTGVISSPSTVNAPGAIPSDRPVSPPGDSRLVDPLEPGPVDPDEDPAPATTAPPVVPQEVSNGPELPTAAVEVTSGGVPEDPQVGVRITAADPDGFVNRVVIDWDDGTPPSVLQYESCATGDNGWPSSRRGESSEHTYPGEGMYDITVTVTSVGCDGRNEQQAIGVADAVPAGTVGATTLPLPFPLPTIDVALDNG